MSQDISNFINNFCDGKRTIAVALAAKIQEGPDASLSVEERAVYELAQEILNKNEITIIHPGFWKRNISWLSGVIYGTCQRVFSVFSRTTWSNPPLQKEDFFRFAEEVASSINYQALAIELCQKFPEEISKVSLAENYSEEDDLIECFLAQEIPKKEEAIRIGNQDYHISYLMKALLSNATFDKDQKDPFGVKISQNKLKIICNFFGLNDDLFLAIWKIAEKQGEAQLNKNIELTNFCEDEEMQTEILCDADAIENLKREIRFQLFKEILVVKSTEESLNHINFFF